MSKRIMQNSTGIKTFITTILLAVVVIGAWYFYKHHHPVAPRSSEVNPLAAPQDKMEQYLKLHHRDAASLLAVFHGSVSENGTHQDFTCLKETAKQFSSDPHVQLTVLAYQENVFPNERRKWLDAFKNSSPDNSLANYLSAEDYFKTGQPELAIQELSDAANKDDFSDFSLTNYLDELDLQQFSGQSDLLANTAAMSAMSGDLLTLLADFKRIATGLLDEQKRLQSIGDKKSVENLSRLGVKLAERFYSGDGGRFVIGRLVGMAIENMALKNLDQNSRYNFLDGKTPATRITELAQEKAAIRELTKNLGMGVTLQPESVQKEYFDRMKADGELAAMRWLQTEHPGTSQNGK